MQSLKAAKNYIGNVPTFAREQSQPMQTLDEERRSTPFWRVRQDCAASRKVWFMDEVAKGIQLKDMTTS
jgi:hypothetical protein